MNVGDIMTRQVISIEPDAPIQKAIRLLLQHGISGLPVVDGTKLVGVVTEGDFLRRAETGTEKRRPRWLDFLMGPGRLASEYVHSHGRTVRDVMTPEPRTVTPQTSLGECVRMMERYRIKRLPVVADGQLVGIVSRANLLRVLASFAHEFPPATADDATIRDGFFKELHRQPWAPRTSIDLVVRDGIVELWGNIFDEREREALRVLAQNIPGVKSVRDHLVWVDPASGFIGLSPEDDAGQKKAS